MDFQNAESKSLCYLGNPEPHMEWFLNDKVVTEDKFIKTMIYEVTEREYHGCLQLDSPTHLNNGLYTLVAKNEFGTDRKRVEAHFMHKPWDGEDPHLTGHYVAHRIWNSAKSKAFLLGFVCLI